MTTVKKGILTRTGLWRKHFRKRLKRRFWRAERQAGRRLAKKEAGAAPTRSF